MNWEDLTLEEGETETTPCDCCRKATVSVIGDVMNGDQFLGWYNAKWAQGHPDVPLRLHVYVGDWSEGAAQDTRWGVVMDVHPGEDGGCSLLDWPEEQRARSERFTMLDREDVLGTDFATELWAMTDAVLMKDTRIEEWLA